MMKLKKLTREQYDMLQQQYDRLPDAGDYSVVGEHFMLIHLLSSFGYRESDKRKAIRLSERLLEIGYD